jgi:hypothetical protein
LDPSARLRGVGACGAWTPAVGASAAETHGPAGRAMESFWRVDNTAVADLLDIAWLVV